VESGVLASYFLLLPDVFDGLLLGFLLNLLLLVHQLLLPLLGFQVL
jgi:hypothetical protein